MKIIRNRKRNAFNLVVCLGLFPVMSFAQGRTACAPSASIKDYDTDGDGAVTAEEFTSAGTAKVASDLAEFLAKYDTDGDGAITTADYTKAPKSLQPLLRSADDDADGQLSAAELQAAADQQTADRLARFLLKYDTDGDESVTTDEITAILQGQVNAQISAFIAKYDTDGDGAISADEVEAAQSARGRHTGRR